MANKKNDPEPEEKERIAEKKRQLIAAVTERTEKRSLKPEDLSVINVQLSIPRSLLGPQRVVLKDKDGRDGARIRDWDGNDQITKFDTDPSDIIRWEDQDVNDPGIA